MAEYQHASDWIPGTPTPYSGVIRTADGKFIACEADSQEWDDYVAWAAIEGNVTDPYLSPYAGGAVIVLGPDEVATGSMLGSMPVVPDSAPVMVDVPAISGTGTVGEDLTCTMGNWNGEPTGYDYRWISQLVDPLGGGDTPVDAGSGEIYTVRDVDAGRTLYCTVTATNGFGSTRAPVSNGIVAVAAVTGMMAVAEAAPAAEEHHTRHSRREYPKEG